MGLVELFLAFLAAMGIPSAITGILVWRLKKNIEKREAKREEREENSEQLTLLMAQNIRAIYTVTKATARAVQRIPDANCNGDMTAALDEAERLQLKEQQFLIDQGVKRIFGE